MESMDTLRETYDHLYNIGAIDDFKHQAWHAQLDTFERELTDGQGLGDIAGVAVDEFVLGERDQEVEG